MRTARALWACIGVAALLLAAGCREEEQGRILVYDKGTYLGTPDSEIGEEEREALRDRARRQAGAVAYTSGGGATSSSVRPPGGLAAPAASGELRSRALKQSAN